MLCFMENIILKLDTIFAAFIGGALAIAGGFFTMRWQTQREKEKDFINRHFFIYQQAIDAICHYLDVLQQESVVSQNELERRREHERGARIQHWKTVAYLRMFGDDELADESIRYFDYITSNKLDLKEKWGKEVLPKAYVLIDKIETRLRALQQKQSGVIERYLPHLCGMWCKMREICKKDVRKWTKQ